MRILMFGWEFPPRISGGLGTACYGITRALAERGQEIIFVLPTVEDQANDFPVRLVSAAEVPCSLEREAGVLEGELGDRLRIRTVGSPLCPYLTEKQYRHAEFGRDNPLKHTLKNEISTAYGPDLFTEICRYGGAAGQIAEKEDFDVIHGHDWMTVPACLKARKISAKPFIYHAHALESDRSGAQGDKFIHAVEKLGMETADHVIAVSHYTKERIVRDYGLSPEKVTVVHNAVFPKEFDFRAGFIKKRNEKIVLFLGRITFQKGPAYFLEAADLVLQMMPEVRFVLAGTGDLLPEMIEKVAAYRRGARIHFTGFLRGGEVERMYALSDIYVMPSVSEPFGISPLEAMNYDIPVIISRQSGVAEILHHALKVDFWNSRELADKIIALLRHPPLRQEMSAGAREELAEIKWEKAAARIMEVYERVAAC